MSTYLSQLIRSFRDLSVLVIGEAMLDRYIEGDISRICQEAPAPVVDVADDRTMPGGAANTAANVASLDASVHLLSAIGDDHEGDLLRDALRTAGVSIDHVVSSPRRRTLAKQRVVSSSQILLRLDQGSTDPLDSETEEELIDHLIDVFGEIDVVIVSDYSYGILTERVRACLKSLLDDQRRLLVVDSKRLDLYRSMKPTAVKPNFAEALRLLNERQPSNEQLRATVMTAHGNRLLEVSGARIAALTLDSEGALIFERNGPMHRTYARPARRGCASGAGDTFLGSLALTLAAGGSPTEAAEVASVAASIVVARHGTSVCSSAELLDQLSAGGKYQSDLHRFAARLNQYRQAGRRIVFTNGCFDILHRGHVALLNRAKALGDILVVGMNADDSIRRLKGPNRPINTLEDRMQVLAALSCIDHIVSFEEETPERLIEMVRPDVFVKGGDYARETLPEAPLVERMGGRVEILPLVQDRSTTGIIQRICEIYAPENGRGLPVTNGDGSHG
ncbi:MAG: D-glycero-beta-D-manno-heptose 1-phosphate adenylyltransferase [Bacteroidota bacterium]